MPDNYVRRKIRAEPHFTENALGNEWRSLIGRVPGAESLNFRSSFFRAGDPVDVQFSGNSLETLNTVSDQLKTKC